MRAKYFWFKCAEGYSNTIDMPTLLHPQTQLTLRYQRNAAARLRLPDQDPHADQARLQAAKYVVAMEVTNADKGGYWEDQGYNWFSGL